MRLRSSLPAQFFSRVGYQVKTRTKRVPSAVLGLLSCEARGDLRRALRLHAGVSEVESLCGVVVGLRVRPLKANHPGRWLTGLETTHTLRVTYRPRNREGVWEMVFGVHADGSLCLWMS